MPDARLAQARALFMQGRYDQAAAVLTRALVKDPDDAVLNTDLARILALQGRHDRALYYLERAARAAPDNFDTLALLGSVQLLASKAAESDRTLERALSLRPSHFESLVGRVNALIALDRQAEAAAVARAGLGHHPENPQLVRPLAYCLLTSARSEEAADLLRAAARRLPNDALLAGALATTLNYAPGSTPEEVRGSHVAYARLLHAAAPADRFSPQRPRPDEAERPLRIGFISPDLRMHPCAFFVEPLLASLDRSKFETTCYSTSSTQDEVTARLRPLSAGWRACFGLPDAEVAARIRSDRIDILVDLAGHTTNSRAGVLVLRPAPVQVTWLGYPGTTGLDEVGYRIVDNRTDPPGSEGQAVERLVRLDPCFLCYRPEVDAPEPVIRPASESVAFGSFNAIQKLSTWLIGLWARVLLATPPSRLVLKTTQLGDPGIREDVLARFLAAGIEPERIDLLPRTSGLREHLAQYGLIDVALDPFPYCGTTTTCDALHMGVPVVTLAGRMHAGRVGVSLLSAVGHPELIAGSGEEYVKIAVDLAADAPRRGALRGSLRQELVASPLRDEAGFARRFEGALRGMWREACGAAGR